MCRNVQVNRCNHHHTVYTHVIAKFIRSMLHSVTCSDLEGLLNLCSVFWAYNQTLHSLAPTLIKTPEQANQGKLQAGKFNTALRSNLLGNDHLGRDMRSPSIQ